MSLVAPGAFVVRGDEAERLGFPVQVMQTAGGQGGHRWRVQCGARTLKAGADGARPHTHRGSSMLFYVLDGRVDVLVGEDVVSAGKGDLAIIAPHTMHAFAAAKDEIADLLILFSPAMTASTTSGC